MLREVPSNHLNLDRIEPFGASDNGLWLRTLLVLAAGLGRYEDFVGSSVCIDGEAEPFASLRLSCDARGIGRRDKRGMLPLRDPCSWSMLNGKRFVLVIIK